MEKDFSLKKLFIRIVLLFPLIYIGLGWYIGLNYGRKGAILGPYPDVPVAIKTHLLGSSLADISGSSALVMVVPIEAANSLDKGSTYFKVPGYFELPGTWNFEFRAPYGKYAEFRGKLFTMTGSYSRAIAHELKNPRRRMGSLSVGELYEFLKATGRDKDIAKLIPYLFIARLEEKYPWLYSDTVFLSRAMSNVFKDSMIPYDILGLAGILVLFIALSIRSLWLWMYYLYWVFAYWIGRVGYHDPNLVMSNAGWQAILWSFWHGFIQKEGRLFLVITMGLSVIILAILVISYVIKQTVVFLKMKNRNADI